MHRPLTGKRVVVTRPASQSASFCSELESRGAIPVPFPAIRVEALEETGPLRAAMGRLRSYDWAVFTSVNGVRHAWEHLTGSLPGTLRVAAIGPATARALRDRGVVPEFMPCEFRAERIAEGLGAIRGQRVLLARAQDARRTLVHMLRARGALVEEVPAYRTVRNTPDAGAFSALKNGVDAITFTSSSTATHFAALVPERNSAAIACIGPITAETARNLGYPVDVVAEEYTTRGLLIALENYFAAK